MKITTTAGTPEKGVFGWLMRVLVRALSSKFAVPVGVILLAGLEFWERASFYGLRGLIPTYLVEALGYDEVTAKAILGNYKGIIYLTPVLGAVIADLFWGQRKALIVGGVLMMLGHFALGVHGLMLLGLWLMVCGNGLFKPNVSTLVDGQYAEEDKTHTGEGYQVFYMGINLGALVGSVVCSFVGEKVNWHLGFALAGLGMACGLWWLWRSWRYLGEVGFKPKSTEKRLTRLDARQMVMATLAIVAVVAIGALGFSRVLEHGPLADASALLAGSRAQLVVDFVQLGTVALAVAWLVSLFVRSKHQKSKVYLPPKDRASLVLIGVILLQTTVMWTIFDMADTEVGTLLRQGTDLTVPFMTTMEEGKEVPATIPIGWFTQSLNPLFIVLLTPVMLGVWRWFAKQRFGSNFTLKLGYGLLFAAAASALMWAAHMHLHALNSVDKGAKISPLWTVGFTFLVTVSELCISPVGLALVARFSTASMQSRLVALFFITSSVGGYLSGNLTRLLAAFNEAFPALAVDLWPFLTMLALGSGLITLVMSNRLSNLSNRE